MKRMNLLNFAFLLLSIPALAHEGHDSPGALPAPPNGGKVAEAEHASAHKGEESIELFAEAKIQGTKISVFALGLDPKNPKVWKPIAPSSNLVLTDVKVELPRSKKTIVVPIKAEGAKWQGEVGAVKERRLIVLATFMDGAEKKVARVQLEK
jgi:hypothetical protein